MAKNIVNALWIGKRYLTYLEHLTMNSFLYHGAEFHLWHYKPIEAPKGVVLRDANEILPASMIFRYPKEMYLDFGANSFVGFSEIFRYKVLYEVGGWWSDMDVTCLKPLDDITDDYWFRFHGVLSVVGNIMKVPPKSELMRLSFEKAVKEVNAEQRDWHHAIRILCYYIEQLQLSKYIHHEVANLDNLDIVSRMITKAISVGEIPKEWRFIHWMNSVCGKNYGSDSIMDQLVTHYNRKHRALML